MQLSFSPIRQDATLRLERQGDCLILNGERLDLSAIPDGATLPRDAVPCLWLASDVERVAGTLHLTLLLPHGADAPQETLFPAAMSLTDDGPVALPPYETATSKESAA